MIDVALEPRADKGEWQSGSTIVDGPEVPEDRDPAQREAEGPRSFMDYSEFDFSPPKQNRSSSVATT